MTKNCVLILFVFRFQKLISIDGSNQLYPIMNFMEVQLDKTDYE